MRTANENINDNTKYVQGKNDNICWPWKMITLNDNTNDNTLKMITLMIAQNMYRGKW